MISCSHSRFNAKDRLGLYYISTKPTKNTNHYKFIALTHLNNMLRVFCFLKTILVFLICNTALVNSIQNVLEHPNWPSDTQDECGISFTDRIVGGINASLGQYPWLARIGYNRWVYQLKLKTILNHVNFGLGRHGISYDCGGVLITKQYVLTAGHCVLNLGLSVEV